MKLNYRISTIVVAVITIVFGIVGTIVAFNFESGKFRNLFLEQGKQSKNLETENELKSIVNIVIASQQISIGFDVLSIVSAAMMFAAVGKKLSKNQKYRFFLLPFLVVSMMMCVAYVIIFVLMAVITFGAISLISGLAAVVIVGFVIKTIFIVLVRQYYKLLLDYEESEGEYSLSKNEERQDEFTA